MKVGDKIIITNPGKTKLAVYDNIEATILSIDIDRVWVDACEIERNPAVESRAYYVLLDCFILKDLYNSPLYKALT